jgi:hypothetical protein
MLQARGKYFAEDGPDFNLMPTKWLERYGSMLWSEIHKKIPTSIPGISHFPGIPYQATTVIK